MSFTRKQMNNIKWLDKQFSNHAYFNSAREYVNIDSLTLSELYNLNGKYIQGTNIMIDVNKKPIKGGNFEYIARGVDFINYLENNK